MITEVIIETFLGIVLGFFSLAPEVDIDTVSSMTEGVGNFWASIWYADAWLPINTMVLAVTFALSLRFVLTFYGTLHHLWKALPFT